MKAKPKLGPVNGRTKWRDYFESDYLASWDIDTDTVVTFTAFKYEEVTGEKGRKDKCLVAYFKEFDKGMILNVTNSKTISTVHESIYPIDWIGKQVTLYVDHNVQMKGETTSGLRIRPVLPIKPRIGDERFAKMVDAIKGGKYEKAMAYESFELSDEQKKTLASL